MRNWNLRRFAWWDWGLPYCQPTYEELKRNWMISANDIISGLPAYLWGIETWISTICCQNASKIASLPMRNWNSAGDAFVDNPAVIASLPMRNWNQLRFLEFQLWLFIASLPMRNWNRLTMAIFRSRASDCQPTYEELKRGAVKNIQAVRQELPAYLWGIETLVTPVWECPQFVIASLPMRNWNFKSSLLFNYPKAIASLPMRNWNQRKEAKSTLCQVIASLPMRNWNKDWASEVDRNLIHCQPTYEELKLWCWWKTLYGWRRLPAYLWGIETLMRRVNVVFLLDIASLPMRNWNRN